MLSWLTAYREAKRWGDLLEAALLELILELIPGRALLLLSELLLELVRVLELLLVLVDPLLREMLRADGAMLLLEVEELLVTLISGVIPGTLGIGPGKEGERKRAMAET